MMFPTVPPNGEFSVEQARLVGRQLAEHPLLATRPGDARPTVAEVLGDARPLLGTYGINFEIVRIRPGCVVARSHAEGSVNSRSACELVKALLGELADQVCDVRAAIVENGCAQRGAPACVYSIVWEDAEAGDPAGNRSPPGPETLIDPEPAFGEFDPPIPPLPDWNRPVGDLMAYSAPESVGPPVDPGIRPAPSDGPRTLEGTPVVTAATSTTHHYQPTTASAVVTPNPVRIQRASAAGTSPHAPAPEAIGATMRRRFPRGLLRRGWLLAIALLAGSAGGWFAAKHAGISYAAQATVVVRSGSGLNGPGGANDAMALATTYAALIPKDQAILSVAARSLKATPSWVSRSLGVSVENGTSIVVIGFSAPSPARAIAGADAVAGAVASTRPVSLAIGPGSVAVVSEPTSAHRQGTLHKYGIVIGGFLGLALGLVLVFAAERADPRVDDAATMATASGCRAASVPNGLSYAELARVLADSGRDSGGLTVVPLAIGDTNPTMELARQLRPWWPADGPAVQISPAFSSGVVELARGSGPTVLVSHPGSPQRDVVMAAQRLRTIGRTPTWAVLANRRKIGASRRVG